VSHRRPSARALALALVMFTVCSTFGPVAHGSETEASRPDPIWFPRVWDDYPVYLHLADPSYVETVRELLGLREIPREALQPDSEGVALYLRVNDAQWEQLVAAGHTPVRVHDPDREGREHAERDGRERVVLGKRASFTFTFPLGAYPSTVEVGEILADLANARPDIAIRYPWGTSVDGRPLWALKVTDAPDQDEAEPEVRLAAGIHGDEPVHSMLLLDLAHELVTSYGEPGKEELTELVDEYELHFLPQINPDGYARGTRWNANSYDLNRNFPEPDGRHAVQQPETLQFMAHALDHNFVISLNGHGGALVVNYPWDYTYTRAPDDAALIALGLEYSTHNLPMYNGAFSQGITNGADWYVITGSLQDWSYARTGCIDLTIEVSNTKWPAATTLPNYWEDNRQSLLHFVRAARYGINGVVSSALDGSPLDAVITVTGNAEPVTTDPAVGDYYKLLPTGTYELSFEAEGHHPLVVADVQTTWGTPTVLDVALVPIGTDSPAAPLASSRIEAVSPNPFNPSTTIRYRLAESGPTTIDVHDSRGRHVRRLLHAEQNAGPYEVRWNGCDEHGTFVGSGVYFVVLRAVDGRRTAKAVLVE
jgi:hypothetical protein